MSKGRNTGERNAADAAGKEIGGAESKAREMFGECTYCDPNFMAIPGIEEALKGYDVPIGNPNPGKKKFST